MLVCHTLTNCTCISKQVHFQVNKKILHLHNHRKISTVIHAFSNRGSYMCNTFHTHGSCQHHNYMLYIKGVLVYDYIWIQLENANIYTQVQSFQCYTPAPTSCLFTKQYIRCAQHILRQCDLKTIWVYMIRRYTYTLLATITLLAKQVYFLPSAATSCVITAYC